MLIRSGMVWGYWWVVARDIGGSAEKWWDYCIFCFSQQTAVAQAVTGVFSTPGCPAPQAPSHWFRSSLTLLFSPPSFNFLLHSNNVPINPISNVGQVSVGEIDLGNVTGCFLFVPSCTWDGGGVMIGDMQSFKCKQSKMGLVDRHQAFLPKRQFSSWLLEKVKKEDDYVEEGS